jgi:hypothetical protein
LMLFFAALNLRERVSSPSPREVPAEA